MDYVRSCYRSSMRLYPDRPDVLVPGRWRRCRPGASAIPFLHSFGSQVWDYTRDFDVSLGEVRGLGAWVNGAGLPQFQGQHFCGGADAWLHGIPYADRPGLDLDDAGVPLCCKPAPYDVHLHVSACGCGACTFSG